MPKRSPQASRSPRHDPSKSTDPVPPERGTRGRSKRDAVASRKPVKRAGRPSGRTIRRIILLVLMGIPLGIIVLLLRQPPVGDPALEVAFYAIGVPIVAVNLWEWASVRVLERPPKENGKK